jgi:hypothetical protein
MLAPFCAIHAQPWSGIIASSRATDWSLAGVTGGIPTTRTQCGSTIAAYTGSASTINAALSACGANQFVQLAAGSFQLSSGIDFGNKSNLTLRGMGADQTLLVFSAGGGCSGVGSNICARSADTNYNQQPSNTANWTAGYAQGTTVITLSSTTNLHVGSQVILDQVSDVSGSQALTDTGAVFTCSAYTCTENGGSAGNQSGYQRSSGGSAVRDEQQVVNVTAISGNQVTINPGLRMPNWRSSQAPGAWWATSPISSDGVENLSVDGTNSNGASNVQFFNCQNCWVSGVRAIAPGRAHVILWNCNHCTVRDSYFYSTQNAAAESYGVEQGTGSDNLVQNNIFERVAVAEMTNSACPGCVYGYNFDVNNYYTPSFTWLMQGVFTHSVVDYLLAEGNTGAGIYFDLFHGTGQFVTAFRNRYNGFQPNNGTATNSHTTPFIVYPYHRYVNLVGNVLGTTGYHTTYTSTQGASGDTEDKSIYVVGTGTVVCCSSGDPLTVNSLLRWGNYDTVNAAARFVSSEVPSNFSDATGSPSQFASPVPASQTLPASFYLSAKPSWWPGGKAWPPIGPDVTGGNAANTGGHANTIPAQDCYTNVMAGPAAGTGSVLTFSAATCYGQQQVQPPPNPPTNLSVSVN